MMATPPQSQSAPRGLEVEITIVIGEDGQAVNYYQQITENSGANFFTSPWGGCLLKNCDEIGDLLEFSKISDYERFMRESKRKLWLYMKLKVFKFDGSNLFGVFVCPECESTASIEGLGVSQDPEVIISKLCLHSRVASMLVGNWRSIWNVSIATTDQVYEVCCNLEDNYATFIPQSTNTGLLAGVVDDTNISILYCTTARQEVPFCSRCVRRKCHHYRKLLAFYSTQEVESTESSEIQEESNEYQPRHDVEEDDLSDDHYMKELPAHIRGRLYGYNYKNILYPFSDSADQQSVWMERMKGCVNIPKQLIPELDETSTCADKAPFNCSNDSLVRESINLCLYNDLGERVFDTEVYARPTVGPCSCLQRFDGHDLLIWNLGRGRFVDYTLLLGYLHKWRVSGISMHGLYRSIVDCAESCGVSSSLTYYDIHRAVSGFFCNLTFDTVKAFSCPTHGTSPRWVVSDGKALGPLKRKVNHLAELDVAEDDDTVLRQSTHYKDRIFINVKKERAVIIKLLTGDMSMEEFTLTGDILTGNGLMVINLVGYIHEKYPEEIPAPYKTFLKNISKNSSARSFIQVHNLQALDYLRDFCTEELDVRIVQHEEKLREMMKSFPALWPTLESICSLEKSKFLPRNVSRIIIEMLKIRFKTFQNATKRSNSEYFLWSKPIPEHPTQCYPTLPLWRHPSKYIVSAQTDSDLCDKTFSYSSDFCAGFYSVGCGCDANITFGFEIMLLKESPRNLFRFLMCRDVDLGALEGILVDFGCLFEPYVMNREASILEDTLVLVDGAHWAGQKKLKKFDNSGKGGHLGCSDGFNFNLFKKHQDENINSQGREQLHSLIDKCSYSLRLMSYRHFMIFMKVFFAVTNLYNRKYK